MPKRKNLDIRSRAMWSGTLTFGMVGIPVALFPASRPVKVTLHMTAPDGTPLKRRYFCPLEDKALEREELARGFEVSKEKFVTVTDEELAALDPEKSREIDLRRFVPFEQIDPMFFDRAYILAPDGDVFKPYCLLAETMERTQRAGIATFVMRGREYLVAILAEKGILRAETLRFPEEIRTPEDIGLAASEKLDAATVKHLTREIRALAAEQLDMAELEDQATAKLLALIDSKKPVSRQPPATEKKKKAGSQVIDLMQILKRSLQNPDNAPDDTDPAQAADELEGQPKAQLYERAQKIDLAGRSAMNKKELVQAIRNAASSADDPGAAAKKGR